MQQIIDSLAKLQNGESKKYSELRKAIADYYNERGIEETIIFDIRTKQGKQQLLALAIQLIAEYETSGEEIEKGIDEREMQEDERVVNVRGKIITNDWSSCKDWFNVWSEIHKDNPEVLTAEGLGRLDLEAGFMIDGKPVVEPTYKSLSWDIIGKILGAKDIPLLRRLCAAPTEFIDEEGSKYMEPKPDDDQMIAFMKSFMDKDSMVRMGFKIRLHEEISKFQSYLLISGLTETEFNCRGLKLSYLTEYGQLHLMPRDARKLWRQIPKVIDCFLQLAAMGEPKYKLSRVDYSNDEYGDNGEDLPTTYTQLREYASKAKAAWIYQNSIEWEKTTTKMVSSTRGEMEVTRGHSIDRRNEPDVIELHLTMGWENFYKGNASDCVTFRLSHPHRD